MKFNFRLKISELKNIDYYILIFFSVVFFFFYNYLNFTTPLQFNSPDETANFVFSKTVLESGHLRYQHPYDYGELSHYVHPRSADAVGDYILPVGFWGLPLLYGFLGKLFGLKSTVFFTSIFVIAGLWSFYFIIREVFDKRVALFSTLLNFSLPPLWYYTARSLFPNVPFFSLVLISFAILYLRPLNKLLKRSYCFLNDFLGLLVLGIALLIRPNEALWVLPVFLVLFYFSRGPRKWLELILWAMVGGLFAFFFIHTNQNIYSDSLGTYISTDSLPVKAWYSIILPFGFNLKQILSSGWHYFLNMFWRLALPAFLGILILLFSWVKLKFIIGSQKVYVSIFIFVSLVLFIYYGSFHDSSFYLGTIGVSYVRYWLPIFMLATPFVFWLFSFIRETKYRFLVVGSYLLLSFFVNFTDVFHGIDGLYANQANIWHANEVRELVLANTDSADIIVTDYEDKFFWPDRQVIVAFKNPVIPEAISEFLSKNRQIYYFSTDLMPENRQVIEEYIKPYGLALSDRVLYKEPHSLYRFELK